MIARAFLVYSAWGASASAKEPSMAHLVKALQDLRQRRGLTTGQFVYTLFLEMHFQPAVFVRPLAAKNSRGTKKWMLSGRCIKCKRKSTVDDMELLRYSHFQAFCHYWCLSGFFVPKRKLELGPMRPEVAMASTKLDVQGMVFFLASLHLGALHLHGYQVPRGR